MQKPQDPLLLSLCLRASVVSLLLLHNFNTPLKQIPDCIRTGVPNPLEFTALDVPRCNSHTTWGTTKVVNSNVGRTPAQSARLARHGPERSAAQSRKRDTILTLVKGATF